MTRNAGPAAGDVAAERAGRVQAASYRATGASPSVAPSSPLCDVREAAAYLRITPRLVRELVRREELAAVRIGQGSKPRLRFLYRELDSFIDRNRMVGT